MSAHAAPRRIVNARVVTLAGGVRPRRGRELGELGVIPMGEVAIDEGRVAAVRAQDREIDARGEPGVVDARGRVVMPAFVDAHTHACWAGSRLDEWEMRLRGAGYLEIMGAGGGIMSTVRSTRAAGEDELIDLTRGRLRRVRAAGTGAIEIKSGYGLDADTELRMLRTARAAAEAEGLAVALTALLGHAIDPAVQGFAQRTIDHTLPAVSAAMPNVAIDAYCERGSWSVEETVRLLARARELGHPVRVHADQFNSLGMVGEAIALGARSVDHLEASTPDDLERLAASETFGVMLPLCGLHLDGRYADARRFADAGGALCLASNLNPGSAPSGSMPLVMALGVRALRLTPAEAIVACTVNPAALLGMTDRGTIEPGMRADLVLLRSRDERDLAYEIDGSTIDRVFLGGAHHDSGPRHGE